MVEVSGSHARCLPIRRSWNSYASALSSSLSRSCRSSGWVNICREPSGFFGHWSLVVPIKLDAVLVRVAQVKRLGDAVIGGAVERDLGDDQTVQRVGERLAGRVEDSRVEEAGSARGGRRAAFVLPGVEAEMVVVAAGRNEGRARVAGGQLEAEHRAVKIERPVRSATFRWTWPILHAHRWWAGQGGFFEGFGRGHDGYPLWPSGRAFVD